MSATDTWDRFRKESENCTARLNSKLIESWEFLRELLRRQAEAFERVSQVIVDSPTLDSLDDILITHANSLLIEPIEKYRRERPQQRTLEALDDWDRAIEGVIGAMPEFLNVTPAEWLALAGTTEMSLGSRLRMTWSRKQVQVAFRENLLYGFQLRRERRVRMEGRLMRVLAECSLELTVPWQSILQIWLPRLLSHHRHRNGFHRETKEYRRRLTAYEKQAAQVLDDFRAWSGKSSEKIANRAPLMAGVSHSEEKVARLSRDYFKNREFWVRQSRAVDSGIDLEFRFTGAERDMSKRARTVLVEIEREHLDLLDELGRVVTWLQNWNQHDSSSFPPAQADIASVANRLGGWANAIDAVSAYVPETVEVASRVKSRRSWRRSFRTETPRLAFRESLQRQSETLIRDGLDHLERQQVSIVREIERAREVVAFASETAQGGKTEDFLIEREGIENARSLLEFHRTQTQHIPPQVERSFVLALAEGFLRTHTMLQGGQFGVARQAARYGLPAATRKALLRGLELLREGARFGTTRGTALYREMLIRVGWIPAPTARVQRVKVRAYLSHTLGSESRLERLPAIYQRLFRVTPVEDPRFLIGRQEEMSALADARTLWEQNREAAVIIVGERGSGKTSLLNCAEQSALAGLEILRSDFSVRLTRSEDMYRYLADLLGVEPQAVDETLNSGRRVVILEELERTFLRRTNHFGALRALINLISKTSKHTLWLISTNYFAFRLLNAAVRMDPHFSHRINAMAVDRNHLRDAILLRHNLSGLRLRFAPAPEQGVYTKGFRKIAGVEVDPETEFFDILYRESGGVFRTAFALWQRYIDRAEAGILYVRYPATPPFDEIVKSMSDLDLFTLAAILQHGSLTPAEHSLVFRIDQTTSNAWLDNLLARELIEPDPGRLGLRVVPEAGELVRRTLFRRNVA